MKKMFMGLASLVGLSGHKNMSKSQTRTSNGSIHQRDLLQAEVYASGPTYAFAKTTDGANVYLPGSVDIVDDELDWYAVRPGRKIAIRVKPDTHGRDIVATLVLFLEDEATAA